VIGPTQVWRLAVFGRVLATVIAAVPAAAAIALWAQAALHPSVDRVVGALVTTGIAAVYGLFIWWMALRPRLALTDDQLVVVNPWGTQRVAVADVVAVTGGLLSARLQLRSGWCVTVFALAEAYGGGFRRGRRIAEVADAVTARQGALGVRQVSRRGRRRAAGRPARSAR
jgi:hypothetical protein